MNSIAKYFGLVWIGSFFLAPPLFGQAGNDNPGGVTAEYYGSITTAGQYDPYTGNARREIDDIVVPGAIGAYPLKYTRIMSTRSLPVGWTGNYNWGVSIYNPDTNNCTDRHTCGPVGRVNYPGGSSFDLEEPYTPGIWYLDANGRHGPDDILVQCSIANSGCEPVAAAEIRRADGGKVLFERLPTAGNEYRAYAILDPYGQRTTLTYYDTLGYTIWKVTEPGGRYLEFVYQGGHLTTVRANDGRGNIMESVNYGYDQGLSHVYYDDGAVATYTYVTPNNYVPPDQVDPNQTTYANLIHSCDDPRYAGPMKYIEYEYVPSTEVPDVARGQIKAEKNILGQRVSSTTYPPAFADPLNDPNWYRRTETRGDGKSRTIDYRNGLTWTDFKNQTFTDTTTATGWTITDPRTDPGPHTTTYEVEGVLGALRKITYPQTDPSQPAATKEYIFSDPANPYYHYKEKDENGNWTQFDRDSVTHQVTKITYADTSTEEFTYNNFGQVLTHKLRSGGTETFTYDTRGLKQTSYPPATESDPDPWNHPTRYYYYTSGPSTDRLFLVEDPRENWTEYEYNQRGQATHIQHQDYTYVQNGYNLDGTLAWTYDENHPGAATDPNQRTRYTYDEYKRVLTVTLPMGQPSTNYYGLDWANPLLHTTNNVKWTKSPLLKNVVYDYDENLRKQYQTVAANTGDIATTFFDYDEVGNLTLVRDPRWYVSQSGYITTYGYDARNRKIWMDDPIASDRNSTGHTMNWEYDAVGNKLKETRADSAFRSWDYDVPNRITHAIDWRLSTAEPAVTTTYGRNVTSTTETITDSKQAVYTFAFDVLHRKINETYPVDATGEARTVHWWYDAAGNVRLYKNPGNQYKHLDYADSYDSRNRLRHSSWNASASSLTRDLNVGQEVTTDYDAASRMTQIRTNDGETTVSFGYDEANRKIWEDQTLAGYTTRRVNTPRDADGNRSYLDVANYYHIDYAYTQRNQLAAVNGFATFIYDPSGNLTNRTATWVYQSGTNYSYDDLNRATQVDYGNAWQVYSTSHYQYDKVSREVATWRDGDGKGERFGYNALSQLTSAKYNADQVWTGNPVNASRNVTYNESPLNRQSVVSDNGFFEGYFADNGMNQYNNVGGVPIGYDGNFNLTNFNGGLSFNYDAESHLVSGSMSCTYDGLGRCVRRTVGGVTKLFTYDDWKPFLEWDGSGNWIAWNIYGAGPDEILARYDVAGRVSIYKQDQHGNVTFVLNQFGNVVEKYTYDAFGKPTIFDAYGNVLNDANGNPHSAIGNRFLFTGREYIQELGIYDYRHRMYMPGIGRFLQSDPMGLQTEGAKLTPEQKALYGAGAPEAFGSSEMNLFRYCGDDPVDDSDPSGLTIVPAKDLVNEWKKVEPELMKDPVMRPIINRLERKDITVELIKTKNPISGATFGHGYRVFWNPYSAGKSKADGTRLSPTVALGHELDHIHLAATKPAEYISNYKTPDAQYRRLEERRVITRGAEASMMNTFYHEKSRSDYDLIPYPVADPLSR